MDTTILNVVSTVGQLGILSRHVPLVTPLAISRMITEESDGRKEYAVAGGLLYFENDLATILTDAIESKEEIDLRRAEEAKQRAEARLDDPNMDMRRAEVASVSYTHLDVYKRQVRRHYHVSGLQLYVMVLDRFNQFYCSRRIGDQLHRSDSDPGAAFLL